jgi:cytidine deaminase
MTDQELVALAKEARNHAYVPYSGFSVGAALLTRQGKVYQGCNIENAAFGPTNCAERTAFFTAIYQGERDFEAIAVVGGRKDEALSGFFPPCGVCRQVMREFCNDDFRVIMGGAGDDRKVMTLAEILPASFSPGDLAK